MIALILVVLVLIAQHQGCRLAPSITPLELRREVPLLKSKESEYEGCSSRQRGYHAVTCPVWYDEKDPPLDLDIMSRERGIDYRVRYFYKRQNPEGDCMDLNFYTKGFRDMSIFNSFKLLLARGLFAAVLTNRVRDALSLLIIEIRDCIQGKRWQVIPVHIRIIPRPISPT